MSVEYRSAVAGMFQYYDKDGDGYLDSAELGDVERHDYLRAVFDATSCHMRDFIILQDSNDDRRLSLAELNVAMGTAKPVTDRIGEGGKAIASVRLSVRLFPRYLRNLLTVDLELLRVSRS